jgi:hypothetical protein
MSVHSIVRSQVLQNTKYVVPLDLYWNFLLPLEQVNLSNGNHQTVLSFQLESPQCLFLNLLENHLIYKFSLILVTGANDNTKHQRM